MPGAVEALIAAKVGGLFTVEERSVVVTTTVAEIFRNNPERAAWLLVNTGATELNIAWARPATGADSIPIPPNGGGLSLNWEEDLTLVTHSLLGSVGAGTTTVLLVSIQRVNE